MHMCRYTISAVVYNLCTHDLSFSVSSGAEAGAQVATRRRLGENWEGEAGAILGVGSIAGTSLGLTYRAERFLASARLEVCQPFFWCRDRLVQ